MISAGVINYSQKKLIDVYYENDPLKNIIYGSL